MIDEKFLIEIRTYLKNKTGKYYFRDIKISGDNLEVTCPYHKNGQESRPSSYIRIHTNERAVEGLFHCFTCGETKMLSGVMQDLLGNLYNEDEVETLFGLKSLEARSSFIELEKPLQFIITKEPKYESTQLQKYEYYHEYLYKRGINEETAQKYNLGYDVINRQITFPIRDINRYCLGIGRRNIDKKFYRYPEGFVKPLYGVYELPRKINFLYVVERSI